MLATRASVTKLNHGLASKTEVEFSTPQAKRRLLTAIGCPEQSEVEPPGVAPNTTSGCYEFPCGSCSLSLFLGAATSQGSDATGGSHMGVICARLPEFEARC